MGYISYNKMWESNFFNIVSKKDKAQDINISQIKFEVHDIYKKSEKIATNFEAVNDEDVINKAYLDEKFLKIDGHIPLLEKNYNEFKILSNKQSFEEALFQRTVKTTLQILYDKGLFDGYPNADEVLKYFSITTRQRHVLEEVNDVVQGFYSKT